jgi:hypothetical protein
VSGSESPEPRRAESGPPPLADDRTPPSSPWRHALALPLTAGLLAYDALDAVLGPVVRPALRALAATRIVQRLEAAIARLPPYGVLALLAIPFVLIEPLKLFSLYWFAAGHPVEGAALLVAAHLLSIVTSERILRVGLPQLMTIGWFARLYRPVVALRDRALAFIRASGPWRACVALAQAARRAAARLFRPAGP